MESPSWLNAVGLPLLWIMVGSIVGVTIARHGGAEELQPVAQWCAAHLTLLRVGSSSVSVLALGGVLCAHMFCDPSTRMRWVAPCGLLMVSAALLHLATLAPSAPL